MPEALLESELFGHVKGAFTGAASDKDGLLIEANGGTIFLDEIAKTSLAMQGKLLQYLDTHKVRKVGSNDLRAQVWETFRNIEKAMKVAGGTLTDIVSMRIYIVGEKYEEDHHITEALKEFFPEGKAPTTTWIRVLGLARKEFFIEIEPVAVIEH